MQPDYRAEADIHSIPPPRPQSASRAIALVALFVLGLAAVAMMGWDYPNWEARKIAKITASNPAPVPIGKLVPSEIVPMERGNAEQVNAGIPLTDAPIPAAAAFWGPAGINLTRSADCLTAAVYYEAASESDDGERAVAQVVLNRVRHPAYPHTVCGVVFQGAEKRLGCQFTFACDGALARLPSAAGWARARRIAIAALSGSVYAPVGWSTHYHANYVVPRWANELDKVAVVGVHIFYRWRSYWGKPGAFNARYAGLEDEEAMQRATLAAKGQVDDMGDLSANAMAAMPLSDFDPAPIRSLDAKPAAPADASPPRWAIRPGGDAAPTSLAQNER